MNRIGLGAVVCCLVLVAVGGPGAADMATFQQGQGGYSGTRDTFMRNEYPELNFGDGGGAISVHDFPEIANKERTSLIEFADIFGEGAGQVPGGQVVTSARLRLYLYALGEPGNGQSVSAAPLLVAIPDYGTGDGNVQTGTVCWAYRSYTDLAWGGDTNEGPVAGLDYDDGQEVTVTVPAETGQWMEWDITTIAQSWYSGALANNGLVLYPGSTEMVTQSYFHSSENASAETHPQLVIEYVPEPTITALLIVGLPALIARRRAR